MVSRRILVFGSSKWRQKHVLSGGVVFVVFSTSEFISIFEKLVFSIWLLATGVESIPLSVTRHFFFKMFDLSMKTKKIAGLRPEIVWFKCKSAAFGRQVFDCLT